MRSQMRLVAAVRSWNFLIGGAPGRLFQIATSRCAGQDFASSANSGWLLKVSNGVLVAAAASSGVACAVMWLSVSIVNVVIVVVLLCRGLRGQHMDHSAGRERQGNSEQYRPWRRDGDGRPELRRIQNCLAFRSPLPRGPSARADRIRGISRETFSPFTVPPSSWHTPE